MRIDTCMSPSLSADIGISLRMPLEFVLICVSTLILTCISTGVTGVSIRLSSISTLELVFFSVVLLLILVSYAY